MKSLTLVLALSLLPATSHAGWFSSTCEDEIFNQKAVRAALEAHDKAFAGIDEKVFDGPAVVRSALTGVPNPKAVAAHTVPRDANELFRIFEPLFAALDQLAGHEDRALDLHYKSNTTAGWVFNRDGNPNVRVIVPANYREVVAANYLVVADTVSGNEFYVLPGFKDHEGNDIQLFFTSNPNVVRSDIDKAEVNWPGTSKQDRASVAQLSDTEHYGIMENIRPGIFTMWGDIPGFSYRVVSTGDGEEAKGLDGSYINLNRVAVNVEKGQGFTLSDLSDRAWNNYWPLHTSLLQFAAPDTTPKLSGDDAESQLQAAILAGTQAQFGAEIVANAAALSTHLQNVLQEAMMPTRLTYLDVMWTNIGQMTSRKQLDEANGVFTSAITGAKPTFDRLDYDLQRLDAYGKWIGDLASAGVAAIDNPDNAEHRPSLIARRADLLQAQAQAANLEAYVSAWQSGIANLLTTGEAVRSGVFAQTMNVDGKTEAHALLSSTSNPAIEPYREALNYLKTLQNAQ